MGDDAFLLEQREDVLHRKGGAVCRAPWTRLRRGGTQSWIKGGAVGRAFIYHIVFPSLPPRQAGALLGKATAHKGNAGQISPFQAAALAYRPVSAGYTLIEPCMGRAEPAVPMSVGQRMDDPQTKREIWFLVLGTIVVQVPVAIAAFVIMSQ